MSTPVTPQEFREAAAECGYANELHGLLLAAADQGEQLAYLLAWGNDALATAGQNNKALMDELSEARTALAQAVEELGKPRG